MITVVIPLYNKEQYIEKAVGSVLRQISPNFELIVVNDGSTDDSLSRVMSFEDPRLKVISQPNSGVSQARNKGVQNAKFDYVAFLDADDWWEPDFLSEMVKAIRGFPIAGLYGCKYQVVKNSQNKPADIGLDPDFDVGFINYFRVYARTFWVPINCSFVVVDKAAFTAVGGFNPALRFGEDLDLWIRMALRYRVVYVNKFLAFSNQDVETGSRALGAGKTWKEEEHVIFNLDYLATEEKKNPELKELLDGLRVRSLLDFYLNSCHRQSVEKILREVDFSRQPLQFRLMYRGPKPAVALYRWLKRMGSPIKQGLFKLYRSTH